jgi:hypothetical protein
VPMSTRMKLGNRAVFIEYIKPSPFLLAFLKLRVCFFA